MKGNNEAAAAEPLCGKRMIFTGPDGIGDYRPRSNYFPRHIGVGPTSPEGTGDLSYLCRAAPRAPPAMPKQSYVGGVGWGWQYNQLLNHGTLLSNMQIKKTDLRTALEDRVTHRFQDPQHAPPPAPDKQPARQTWTHINDTNDTDKSKHSAGKKLTDASPPVGTEFHRNSRS